MRLMRLRESGGEGERVLDKSREEMVIVIVIEMAVF